MSRKRKKHLKLPPGFIRVKSGYKCPGGLIFSTRKACWNHHREYHENPIQIPSEEDEEVLPRYFIRCPFCGKVFLRGELFKHRKACDGNV